MHLEASFTEAALHPTWGWGEARVFSFFKHPHPPFISRPLTSHRNVASLRSDWDSAVMKRHHLQRVQRFLHFFHLLCAPFLSSAFLLESLHDFTSADEHVHIHMFLITACPDVFNSSSLHASVSPRSKPYFPPNPRAGARPGWAVLLCDRINHVTRTQKVYRSRQARAFARQGSSFLSRVLKIVN